MKTAAPNYHDSGLGVMREYAATNWPPNAEELHQSLVRHSRAVARRHGGDVGIAEDVVQEAYERVLEFRSEPEDWIVYMKAVVNGVWMDTLNGEKRYRHMGLTAPRCELTADGWVTRYRAVRSLDEFAELGIEVRAPEL